jgi:hypothetical protein
MPKKPWIPTRKSLLGRLKIIATRSFPYKKGKERKKGVKQEDSVTPGFFIAYLQRLAWFDDDEPETRENKTGMDTIAQDMGVSVRTAHACRAQAEEWNLVTRTPRAMYTTSISKLLWDAIEAVPAKAKLERKPIAGKPVVRKELTPEQIAQSAADAKTMAEWEEPPRAETEPVPSKLAVKPAAKPEPKPVPSKPEAKPAPKAEAKSEPKAAPEDPRIKRAVEEIMSWELVGDKSGPVFSRVSQETGKRLIDTYGNQSVHSAISRLAQKYPAGDLIAAWDKLLPSQCIAILNGRNPPGLLYDLMEKNLKQKAEVNIGMVVSRYYAWKRNPNMAATHRESLAETFYKRIGDPPIANSCSSEEMKQTIDTMFEQHDMSGMLNADFDRLINWLRGEEEEPEEKPDRYDGADPHQHEYDREPLFEEEREPPDDDDEEEEEEEEEEPDEDDREEDEDGDPLYSD